MDIQKIAANLQAFARERLGRDVPIAKGGHNDYPAKLTDAIVWSTSSSGDIYSGVTHSDELTLVLPRPDIGAPFKVQFSYALHELSGQCDRWEVRVDGATPADIDALSAVFSPTQNTEYWNNHVGPALYVDGVETSFAR
jgi:hypothetical protein